MVRYALGAMVAMVGLAVAGVGCGDDDSEELSGDSSAAVKQIDSICVEWKKELDAKGPFPVKGFDPEKPNLTALPTVGHFFAQNEPLTEKTMEEIRGVQTTPDVKAKVDALVGALDHELAVVTRQSQAAEAGDASGFKATLKDASSSQKTVEKAAKDLGAKHCAF